MQSEDARDLDKIELEAVRLPNSELLVFVRVNGKVYAVQHANDHEEKHEARPENGSAFLVIDIVLVDIFLQMTQHSHSQIVLLENDF